MHRRRSFISPKIIICVPSCATPVERRAIQESAENAGAREVFLLDEPMAAAIGAGLPCYRTCWINGFCGYWRRYNGSWGCISWGLVYSNSVRVGGDTIDEAIISYIRRTMHLLIGEATAERIKKEIASACPPETGSGLKMKIKGRDLKELVPKEIEVDERQIAESIAEPVQNIVTAVLIALKQLILNWLRTSLIAALF